MQLILAGNKGKLEEKLYNIKMSIKSKKCASCKHDKPLKEFYKRVLSKDSLAFWCKDCSKKCSRDYYYNNREKILKASRLWIEANREQHNLHSREWARKNADRIRIINARAYQKRMRAV